MILHSKWVETICHFSQFAEDLDEPDRNGTYSSGATYFRTFRGVAPNTKLINLKVLDQNGIGTDSQVIAAIQRAIALKKTYNIRVINLSLGRPASSS